MDLDPGSLLLLVVLMVAPAFVVFGIMNYLRVRRGKFHRQRITKKGDSSKT
jgi:hypothetical protein